MRLLYEKIPYKISESIHAVSWSWPQITCPYHYHPELEIVWIQRSRGRMSIGDYQGEFQEGDLFLIGSNVPHVFYNTDEHRSAPDAAKALVIQFPENFLGERSWRIPELMEIGNTLKVAKRGIQFRGGNRARLQGIMRKMLGAEKGERIYLLLQILHEWSKERNQKILNNLGSIQEIEAKKEARIQKALTYLSERLQERVTLGDLSKHLFMTPTSLSRFFRQKMGISLVDYVNTQRIALSCQLLASGDRTISEICYEVGFENLSNFNRQFLKRKHCSPREFRDFYK